jgi:hypothetical protein
MSNDPIKVRQPGGVLEFVQQENGNYNSGADGRHYWVGFNQQGERVLDVTVAGVLVYQAKDRMGQRGSPTTLFAIAETIHARLTEGGASNG